MNPNDNAVDSDISLQTLIEMDCMRLSRHIASGGMSMPVTTNNMIIEMFAKRQDIPQYKENLLMQIDNKINLAGKHGFSKIASEMKQLRDIISDFEPSKEEAEHEEDEVEAEIDR